MKKNTSFFAFKTKYCYNNYVDFPKWKKIEKKSLEFLIMEVNMVIYIYKRFNGWIIIEVIWWSMIF